MYGKWILWEKKREKGDQWEGIAVVWVAVMVLGLGWLVVLETEKGD